MCWPIRANRCVFTELVTPLKPLEAMAQKRLFVASDVGGHRELIIDGETGVLHKADDSASLADKLCWVLENPDRWPAMKEAGREFVETQRNWSVSVANYAPVYANLGVAGRSADLGWVKHPGLTPGWQRDLCGLNSTISGPIFAPRMSATKNAAGQFRSRHH